MSFPRFDPEPATPKRCSISAIELGGVSGSAGALIWAFLATTSGEEPGSSAKFLRELAISDQWHRLAATILESPPLGPIAFVGMGLVGGMLLGALGPVCGWRRMPRPLAWLGVGACAVSLLALATAALAAATRPAAAGPNVLLVVLDTTRRDRLTPYGYERDTTPRLARFAEEGLTFTNAYSVSSWTCPSHASLFTGLYPVGHGVTQEAWSLPTGHLTLAEILWEEGYRTMGSVGNPMVGSRLGFQQGFDEFHEDWRVSSPDTPANDHPAVRNLEAFLVSEEQRSFFAFVNLIEVHSPYRSGPHQDRFVRHTDVELSQNDWRNYFTGVREGFTPQELEHLSDLYDAELRYTDDIVGALLDRLESRGVLDETLVIVTSDHGEHFGQHDLVDHVFNLYEGNVAVPLLVRYPPEVAMGSRSDLPVQLQDLFYTVLRVTGAERWARGTDGVDLLDAEALEGDRGLLLSYGYPDQAFGACGSQASSPALDPYRRRLWGLRRGPWKLVLAEPEEGEPTLELFDLDADPNEANDLAQTAEGARLAAELRAELEELRRRHDRGLIRRQLGAGSGELDAATQETLSSLGYVEGTE